jgi:hypothetical protein
MSGNRTPFGRPIELPDITPLRVNAIFDSESPCLDHQLAYTGSIPCTGVLQCSLCLSRWDDNGEYLGRRKIH